MLKTFAALLVDSVFACVSHTTNYRNDTTAIVLTAKKYFTDYQFNYLC